MKSYFSFIAYIIVNKIQIISSYQAEFSYPTFMIDFSTNIFIIYRSSIYMAPTYSYEKQQINLFYETVF